MRNRSRPSLTTGREGGRAEREREREGEPGSKPSHRLAKPRTVVLSMVAEVGGIHKLVGRPAPQCSAGLSLRVGLRS